jgi:hypothetical protein
MVLPGQRLRGVEGNRSSLMDPWKAYAFFDVALFRLLTASRYPSWLGKEYSYVCSTLITSSNGIHARLSAPQLSTTSTASGLPD